MLDTQTKRRLDDCCDFLVGKLPDPKAQIEQITIGLICKFIDDMDKESIDLGGTAGRPSVVIDKQDDERNVKTQCIASLPRPPGPLVQ